MLITGQYTLKVSKKVIWDALNNPSFLAECIQGCESLEKTSDIEFFGTVKSKIGPVSAKFSGSIILSNINPPNSYTITGNAKGGAAGFAKGKAHISLEEINNETKLTYNLEANVGGKIAQLGARLISGTIKKYADDFFAKLEKNLLKNDIKTGSKTDIRDLKLKKHKEIIDEKDNNNFSGKSFFYWVISVAIILIASLIIINKIS